jgi:DNA-directed RNA polymerase specialized sigma24 family protein
MVTHGASYTAPPPQLEVEELWRELYPKLYALARHIVYRFRVASWCGQEEDMIDDVVQETIRRILERSQKAERGEAAPIYAVESMMVVVAQNYLKDLRRRDRRVIRLQSENPSRRTIGDEHNQQDIAEVATEKLSDEWLFRRLAREIASFPEKRCMALLTDLANLMCFENESTPLQAAFLAVGIDLQVYQLPFPNDPEARARQRSLLSLAYKCVAHLRETEGPTPAA